VTTTAKSAKKSDTKNSVNRKSSKDDSRKHKNSKSTADSQSGSSSSESDSEDSDDSDDNDGNLNKEAITKKLIERLKKLDKDRKNTMEVLEKLEPTVAEKHPANPSLEQTANLIRSFQDPANRQAISNLSSMMSNQHPSILEQLPTGMINQLQQVAGMINLKNLVIHEIIQGVEIFLKLAVRVITKSRQKTVTNLKMGHQDEN
jgi:hypothetical protein